MTDIAAISGTLTRKDLKRLTGTTRSGTVGPTTVYYAGVTAPIISAGVAVFSRNLMQNAEFLTNYWVWFISTLIAAFSGICWYLIFIRWSYRNTHGRGGEATIKTRVSIEEAGLIVDRGHIKTSIGWPAIEEVRRKSHFTALLIKGGDTILIPDHWFGKDTSDRDAFYAALNAHTEC